MDSPDKISSDSGTCFPVVASVLGGAVRYLLMICGDESQIPDPASSDPLHGCGGWSKDMQERGILRDSVGLHSPSDATTVRVRDGEVLIVDGPFAETKDQIGGFSLIECADLDEAVEIASRHPAAMYGMIEIRPVRDMGSTAKS
jgi:hypothetical protein